MEVRLDGCGGAVIASLPLAPARSSDALGVLEAPLAPVAGRHDLCFVFASGAADPLWTIDEVQLLP